MFRLAATIAAAFEPVTVYHHQETDQVEERDGRQYRRWIPVAATVDPAEEFRRRLLALPALPDGREVRAIHEDLLTQVQLMSQATEEWRPVLTDEEWAAERQRQQELATIERRRPSPSSRTASTNGWPTVSTG